MASVIFKTEELTTLPESGEKYVIYIVGTSLYIWDGTQFVQIGGGNITVDSALSDSSENPVQNKVVKAAIDAKQNNLVFTGTYDNIAISSLRDEGFYYVTNPTDAPTGIDDCIVEVTRAIQNVTGGYTGVFVHQIVTGTRGDHDQLINDRYERYVRKMPSASSYTVGRWFRVLVEENTNDMLTELGIPWTNGSGIDFTTEAYGHITGARKYLHLMIPLDKIILDTITASDITSLVISIRHPSGGYIIGDGTELVGMTGITIGDPTICLNCLRIIIQSTTDLYTTNNIPVTGQVTIKTS